MLHRMQHLGIDPGQPRQGLRIQPIVFLPALPDQPHLARLAVVGEAEKITFVISNAVAGVCVL
jgi:hypothetical protein